MYFTKNEIIWILNKHIFGLFLAFFRLDCARIEWWWWYWQKKSITNRILWFILPITLWKEQYHSHGTCIFHTNNKKRQRMFVIFLFQFFYFFLFYFSYIWIFSVRFLRRFILTQCVDAITVYASHANKIADLNGIKCEWFRRRRRSWETKRKE